LSVKCVIAVVAREGIDPAIAQNGIVQSIARPVDGAAPCKRQILDIRSQCIGNRTLYSISTFISIFGNNVARTAYNIRIIAQSPDHRI